MQKHATLKGKYVLVGLAYSIDHSHINHTIFYCVEPLAANASLPSFIASAPRYHHQRIKLSNISTQSV